MAETRELGSRVKGRPALFVSKTVADITEAFERALFSEEHARLPGLLQSIDPRAKLLSILLLLAMAGLVRHLAILLVIYVGTLLLAWLSRVPLELFVKRVWLGMPLFAAMIALPALVLIPGRPLIYFPELAGIRISVTDNGLGSAILLVARVGTSVSLAMLLVLTTRWSDLLKALRTLYLPESFVVVLGMTYRYLFILLRLASDFFLARASRTVGPSTGTEQRRWAAGSVGVLVARSIRMSEDVHLAMQARGFTGEVRTLVGFKMRDEDWLALGIAVALTAGLLLLDRGIA